MERNPKVIAGIAGIVILLVLCVIMATKMIPTIGEVQREMSLTPTPLPPVPDTVRAKDIAEELRRPALHNGSQGEEVWKLQERLQALGYYMDAVDGQYGPGTRDAVVAFQQQNGLDADGLAGEETQKVLYSEEAVPKQ